MNTPREVSVESNFQDYGINYLILIAVDEYQGSIQNLHNPVDDAKAVKECLIKKYQFDAKNCIEIYDLEATRKKIIDTLDQFENQLTEADNLFFFYSGHGTINAKKTRGAWVVADSIENDRSSFLPNSEIKNFIQHLQVKHFVGIIDSCFSGALFRKAGGSSPSRHYELRSRYLLTSGRLEPVPDGHPGKHSPFCRCLLEQLNQNEKPILWMSELKNLIRENIEGEKDSPLFRGDPLSGDYGHQGGEFAFLMKGFSIEEENIHSPNYDQVPNSKKAMGKDQKELATNLKIKKIKGQFNYAEGNITNNGNFDFRKNGKKKVEKKNKEVIPIVKIDFYAFFKEIIMNDIISERNHDFVNKLTVINSIYDSDTQLGNQKTQELFQDMLSIQLNELKKANISTETKYLLINNIEGLIILLRSTTPEKNLIIKRVNEILQITTVFDFEDKRSKSISWIGNIIKIWSTYL